MDLLNLLFIIRPLPRPVSSLASVTFVEEAQAAASGLGTAAVHTMEMLRFAPHLFPFTPGCRTSASKPFRRGGHRWRWKS